MMSEKKPYDDVEFDWIQLSADLDPSKAETFIAKWKRKFGENPFVPIGKCKNCDAIRKQFDLQKNSTTLKIPNFHSNIEIVVLMYDYIRF